MFRAGQKGACGRKCSLNIWEHLVTSLHIMDEQLGIKLNCDLLETGGVKGNRGCTRLSRLNLSSIVKTWGLFEKTKAPRGVKLPPSRWDVRWISSWDFCWPSHRQEAVGEDTPCSGYIRLGVVSDQHRFNGRQWELYFFLLPAAAWVFLLAADQRKGQAVTASVRKVVELESFPWHKSLESFRVPECVGVAFKLANVWPRIGTNYGLSWLPQPHRYANSSFLLVTVRTPKQRGHKWPSFEPTDGSGCWMGSANPMARNVPVNVDAVRRNKIQLTHSTVELTWIKPEISTRDSPQAECETTALTYLHYLNLLWRKTKAKSLDDTQLPKSRVHSPPFGPL